jgi:hypothetical protein
MNKENSIVWLGVTLLAALSFYVIYKLVLELWCIAYGVCMALGWI